MACSPIALPSQTDCPSTFDFNLDFVGEVLRVLPLTGSGFYIFLSGGASIYVPEIVPTWLTSGAFVRVSRSPGGAITIKLEHPPGRRESVLDYHNSFQVQTENEAS